MLSETPIAVNLYIKPLCQTLSKAVDIFKYSERVSKGGKLLKIRKFHETIDKSWLTHDSVFINLD